MRVLLTGMDWFPNRPGGLNRYFYGEVAALAAAGITGTALVTYLAAGQIAPLKLRAMARTGASLGYRWRGARRVVRQALREDIQLINAHFALFAYPWLHEVPSHIPLVVNFHGPWADEMALEVTGLRRLIQPFLARHIERRVYGRADCLITLSQAFKEIAHQRYGIPLHRIRVIPGGVDLAPYLAAPTRPAARERLRWPAERRILLAVRRLARRMGLEELVQAMLAVREAHPDVLLLIGGKGALADELQARIARHDLQEHVRLLGFVPDADLPLAYAAADISVVPTVALEGFGLITVESLASGTPVLGTAVGGTPEILHPLQSELIFEQPTAEAMSSLIQQALSGRLALPDGAACRAYAQRFGWAAVMPQVQEVFEAAIAERT